MKPLIKIRKYELRKYGNNIYAVKMNTASVGMTLFMSSSLKEAIAHLIQISTEKEVC